MEKCPSWEAHNLSTSKNISRPSWNMKVQRNFHKTQSLYPTLSQLNRISNLQTALKSCFNTTLSSTLDSPECIFPFGFYCVSISHFLMRASCPNYLILIYLITLTVTGEKYKIWSHSLRKLFCAPVPSSPLVLTSHQFVLKQCMH
jgi:hypothetical protein